MLQQQGAYNQQPQGAYNQGPQQGYNQQQGAYNNQPHGDYDQSHQGYNQQQPQGAYNQGPQQGYNQQQGAYNQQPQGAYNQGPQQGYNQQQGAYNNQPQGAYNQQISSSNQSPQQYERLKGHRKELRKEEEDKLDLEEPRKRHRKDKESRTILLCLSLPIFGNPSTRSEIVFTTMVWFNSLFLHLNFSWI
jgi:hypothetical protein